MWHVPQSTTWRDNRAPGTFSLRTGDNTIQFYARESGSFVDGISVTPG